MIVSSKLAQGLSQIPQACGWLSFCSQGVSESSVCETRRQSPMFQAISSRLEAIALRLGATLLA